LRQYCHFDFSNGLAHQRVERQNVAVLVVEVSDSTLYFDRQRKSRVYARMAIPEYWIINLIEQVVEVHRDPIPQGAYATRNVFRRGQVLSPVLAPSAEIAVDDLLP